MTLPVGYVSDNPTRHPFENSDCPYDSGSYHQDDYLKDQIVRMKRDLKEQLLKDSDRLKIEHARPKYGRSRYASRTSLMRCMNTHCPNEEVDRGGYPLQVPVNRTNRILIYHPVKDLEFLKRNFWQHLPEMLFNVITFIQTEIPTECKAMGSQQSNMPTAASANFGCFFA